MKSRRKILILLLLTIMVLEWYLVYKLSDPTRNVIPLSNYIYNELGSNFIDVQWTRTADIDIYNPIQSSEIFCSKQSMLCTEARAELSSDWYLSVSNTFYDVDIRNNKEITTKPNISWLGCTKYIMRFDRIQKQVTASRTTISNTWACLWVSSDPMYLHLIDWLEAFNKTNK